MVSRSRAQPDIYHERRQARETTCQQEQEKIPGGRFRSRPELCHEQRHSHGLPVRKHGVHVQKLIGGRQEVPRGAAQGSLQGIQPLLREVLRYPEVSRPSLCLPV